MEIAIVGHGPSLLMGGKGKLIDSFDYIIRQKRCSETLSLPKDYGTRTNIVCGSYTIASELPKDMPGCEYWVFMDSRHTDISEGEWRAMEKFVPCTIKKKLCDDWNELYRKSRSSFVMYEGQEAKKTSDDMGHTHMSAGLHTLIYACEILRPDKIVLFGYDNVKSGGFTWSVTRGPDWRKYPDHNWMTEKSLIPVIEEEFNVRVEFN